MSETEKITIDPVQLDLLVQEGFHSNRTDFIRTAIRNQLAAHADEVRRTVARKTLVLGLEHHARRDLEAVREAGRKVSAEGSYSKSVKKGTLERPDAQRRRRCHAPH